MKNVFAIVALIISCSSFANEAIRVNILALTGATSEDETRIFKALDLIEDVVNSEEFKLSVLNMKYKVGSVEYKGFSQTTMTEEQVLESILLANENFPGGEPHQIDLFMDMYYRINSTVGYTGPKDKFIHMNRHFHARFSPHETAGNIFHEWLHKIGHNHSSRNNSERPHSVPYKLGKLLSEMSAEIESQGDPILKELMLKDLGFICNH
jgi:hypothetical protein